MGHHQSTLDETLKEKPYVDGSCSVKDLVPAHFTHGVFIADAEIVKASDDTTTA